MYKLSSSKSFSFNKNQKNSVNKLFKRVSEEELKQHPEIQDAIQPKPIVFFQYLRQDKTPLNEKTINNHSRNRKHIKFINQINNVRSIFHDCLKFQNKQKKKISQVNKLDQNFSKDYEEYKEQEKKAQFNQSSLFDELSSQYEKMNYKLPDIKDQSKHNAFRQNPLIESKNHLENYFKYHREPHVDSKAMKYMKRVDKIVTQSIMYNSPTNNNDNINNQPSIDQHNQYTGSNNLNYKDLTEEILKHQSDIQMLYKSIDDAQSFDNFYTTKVKCPDLKIPIQLKKKLTKNISAFNNSSIEKKTNVSRDLNKNGGLSKKKNKSLDLNLRKSILETQRKSFTNGSTEKKSPLERIYDLSINSKTSNNNLCELIRDYFNVNNVNCESKVNNSSMLRQFRKEKNIIMRGHIQETYDIQRGKNNKIEFPLHHLKILERNNNLKMNLCKSEKEFLKMIHDPQLGPL